MSRHLIACGLAVLLAHLSTVQAQGTVTLCTCFCGPNFLTVPAGQFAVLPNTLTCGSQACIQYYPDKCSANNTINATTTEQSQGLSAGAIAGIVIVAVLVLALAIWLLWRSCIKPKNLKEPEVVKDVELATAQATAPVTEVPAGPRPYDPATYQVPALPVPATTTTSTTTSSTGRRGSLYAPGGEYGVKASVSDATTTVAAAAPIVSNPPINYVDLPSTSVGVASAPEVTAPVETVTTTTTTTTTTPAVPEELVPAIQAAPRRESGNVVVTSPTYKPETYMVKFPFHPRSADEIVLHPGQQVKVAETYRDGFCYGQVVGGDAGFFPSICVSST